MIYLLPTVAVYGMKSFLISLNHQASGAIFSPSVQHGERSFTAVKVYAHYITFSGSDSVCRDTSGSPHSFLKFKKFK